MEEIYNNTIYIYIILKKKILKKNDLNNQYKKKMYKIWNRFPIIKSLWIDMFLSSNNIYSFTWKKMTFIFSKLLIINILEWITTNQDIKVIMVTKRYSFKFWPYLFYKVFFYSLYSDLYLLFFLKLYGKRERKRRK